MVDNNSKDESSTVRSASSTYVYDTVRENFIRWQMFNQQYAQAFSNFQLDYIQTIKNMIQNTISAQKQLLGKFRIPVSTPYIDQFARQSNDITNNTLRAVDINNKLATNPVDVAKENLKI